jgi:phosphoenolpyruvate synthase/pyruvate phosphate dikinase
MNVLWLGQSGCHEVSMVGGKVASLSRLAEDYRVPPGFCLTTAAFERHPPEAAGTLHIGLREILAEAYTCLAERCGMSEPSVAVRSSAVDEDGRSASFAGQYETYLNIVGIDEVGAAVERCRASLVSSRVQEYGRRHGLSPDTMRLAVLVQQLVPSDVSAVVFSANPVTGNGDEVVINASWGLGESIVGGTVTPDTYVVGRMDMTVVSKRVSEKRRMTVSAQCGTREVDVPRVLRGKAALDDDQIREMADLAIALQLHHGWPVDIECAYHAGRLYLLQCRPITTLAARG